MQELEGGWSGLTSGAEDAIAAEAARLLRTPGFQRSEVLSRLLTYLVRMTAEGRSVKAFEIAVDGLGRAERESVDSDTYARVVVARLRKALGNYYRSGEHDCELYIDPGSYVVRLRLREPPEPQPEPVPVSTGDRSAAPARRRWNPVSLALGAVVIASLLAIWHLSSRTDARIWANPNFPNVAVARAPSPTSATDACRSELITALGGFTGVRLVEAGAPADYEVRIFPAALDGKSGQVVRLVHRPTNRFLWSHSVPSENECLDAREMRRTALAIAGPGCMIESFARRRGVDPQTPYGCWLQFTQSLKVYNTVGNGALEQCASDWYSVAGDHPAAAFLYSWTLIDQGATDPVPASRVEALQKALQIATKASLLNSEFASLHIARMRAQSFLGNREGALSAARQALKHAQNNPVITGMAASSMAMWDDPEGERTLLAMDDDGDQTMPWENAGLFIAAMMRDDPGDAGVQIAELDDYDSGQPVLGILKAAWLARTGKRRQADAVLESLEGDPRVWIAGKGRLIERLPMAPEVKRQLNRWLATGEGGAGKTERSSS